jgi:8-oxo-dGTP pyrophosphatase MutT (NUDIX family)
MERSDSSGQAASFGPEIVDRLRARLPDNPPTPETSERRAAAVLVPLFVVDGEVGVVLTQRTAHLRRHSGQVSFPGGAWEPGDANLKETALRESFEEIGLDPLDVDVLGAMDDVDTVGSDYVVRPYVAQIPHPYEFVPDSNEVDRIILPPLDLFADLTRRRVEERERDGKLYSIYFFDFEGAVVWGATARMLVSLVELLEDIGRPPIGSP